MTVVGLPDKAVAESRERVRSMQYNVLSIGPPGAGQSMLAARLPGRLPPLDPSEALEVSMIHSLSGGVAEGGLVRRRPS